MTGHPVVHIDIPASDTKGASQFYADVFGWKITPTEFDYPLFHAEGGPGGGFASTNTPGSMDYKVGEVLIYINTDDIDASLATVVAHGGKVLLPKTEIPQNGWFAFFADPEGNRIGLYTPPQANS
jgi:predicted enzyme related to lactoylglutathione lyase